MLAKTVEDVCKYVGGLICKWPLCVETGSTYCIDKANLVHTTTNNIAHHVCLPNQGMLVSIDIDAEHQAAASSVCDPAAYIQFICGDSAEVISRLWEPQFFIGVKPHGGDGIDLLWLDSKEFDEDHAVNEFRAAEPYLSTKHFVMVDDIHNPNSVKYKKIVPLLKELGYSYVEIPTPTGLFLATRGYPI